MFLNVNSGTRSSKVSNERKYGNLIIDTTIKEDRKIIDLSRKVKEVKEVTGTVPVISKSGTVPVLKGQKVSISSKARNLSKLLIALDWKCNYKGKDELDLDTSIFMVDENGYTSEENFIFYGNPKSSDGGVAIGSDYNLGLKKNYNEVVQLNLDIIPKHIKKLGITLTVYDGDSKNENFNFISDAYFRIIDCQSKKELLSYNFNEENEGAKVQTAIVVAEIYRHGYEWKLNPIGNGFSGGLRSLCENYGIETE